MFWIAETSPTILPEVPASDKFMYLAPPKPPPGRASSVAPGGAVSSHQ